MFVGIVSDFRNLSRAEFVDRTNQRHYRQIAQTVLRWYVEMEDGVIQSTDGPKFDVRVLDYRIDVDRILKKFPATDVMAVLLVNRDGITNAQAVTITGIKTQTPDAYIEDVEIRLGRAFERLRLDEFLDYVDYLRA